MEMENPVKAMLMPLQQFGEFNVYYCFLLGVVALLYFAYSLASKKSKHCPPPSPWRLPIIGNLHQLGHLPHRSLGAMSLTYGPLMLLHLGSRPMLVVSSSEAMREIIKSHDVAFAGKPVMTVTKKIFCDNKDVINLPYGDQWRKLRGIFVNRLLHGNRVKSFNKIRDEETQILMERIGKLSSSAAPVNLSKMLAAMANDLICRAAFGKKHSETEHGRKFLEKIGEAVTLIFNFTLGEFVPWLRWINWVNGFDARVDKIARERDEVMDAVLREHFDETAAGGDSFMDILMDIYKGNTAEVSIDKESVKAVILDVFGAGTESSATTMGWAMTELVRHPKIMRKLQTEIREVMNGKAAPIDDSDLAKMPYLKAVIKENFRYHPPVGIYFHETTEDVKLMGYDVRSGTMVLFNVWAMSRESESWEEPEKFNPDRFLNSTVDYKGFDFQFIPFGAGRRVCPGIAFSSALIEHVLANLLHRFDWESADGEVDVTEQAGITITRKNPLVLAATAKVS